jgi:two-component system KDP operon response regulator KdpE
VSTGRVLLVDDEPQIRRVLRITLADEGYEVTEARNGEDALELLRTDRFDLVLLDVNMPGMGGIATCSAIRAVSDCAILMLTVRDSEGEKIAALDAGADGYVTKPFSTPELLARIRSALRRTLEPQTGAPKQVDLGDVRIDFERRTVTRDGDAQHLTPKEFDLLQYLISHPNRAIPHRELLQRVWGPEYGDEVEYLRVFMKQLRRKIEPDPAKPQYLLTEPWVGYRFSPPSL